MNPTTKTESEVKKEINCNVIKHGSLRKIHHLYPRVSIATLSRILRGCPFPKKPEIRAALSLPCLVEVPICPIHGKVHQRKCHPTFAIRVAQSELKEIEKESILEIFKYLKHKFVSPV